MVTPNKPTTTKHRVGFTCPGCARFNSVKIALIEAMKIDDQINKESSWFQGRTCACGAYGNVMMAMRNGKWKPIMVTFVTE